MQIGSASLRHQHISALILTYMGQILLGGFLRHEQLVAWFSFTCALILLPTVLFCIALVILVCCANVLFLVNPASIFVMPLQSSFHHFLQSLYAIFSIPLSHASLLHSLPLYSFIACHSYMTACMNMISAVCILLFIWLYCKQGGQDNAS